MITAEVRLAKIYKCADANRWMLTLTMPKNKITIVGIKGSGKSALCERLKNKKFSDSYDPTLAASFYGTTYFDIWDSSGAIKYRHYIPIYLKESVLLCCLDGNKTVEQNKKEAITFLSSIQNTNAKVFGLYVIVTKDDALKDEASEYENLAEILFKDFVYLGTCSAKEDRNIEEIFNILHEAKNNNMTSFMSHVKVKLKAIEKPETRLEKINRLYEEGLKDTENAHLKKKKNSKRVTFFKIVEIIGEKETLELQKPQQRFQ